MLRALDSKWASTGLWMVGFIFLVEEIRKAIVRWKPKGWLARLTVF